MFPEDHVGGMRLTSPIEHIIKMNDTNFRVYVEVQIVRNTGLE